MTDIQNIEYDKLYSVYEKYFSLHYLNTNLGDKLACIALTCYITNEVRKKNKNVRCYDVLLKICPNFTDVDKKSFLKALGVLCDDMMYGCTIYPDFGVKPKEMTDTLKNLLNNYVPF